MVKKVKKQKVVEVKPDVKTTRQEFMMQAKDRGVKNFRVLNKEELGLVLAEGVTQEQIDQVVSGAVTRWKSGWGSKKVKS